MTTYLLRFLLAGVLALGSLQLIEFWGGDCAARQEAVLGQYVEARSATVFAGACHVNGEVESQGRHALLAWQVDEGYWRGQDLSGVEVAAAVVSSDNLGLSGPETARVFIEAADVDQRGAAIDWLRDQYGSSLGQILTIDPADIEFTVAGEEFSVQVAERLEMRGRLEPDRSCCTMPEKVWYEPLARVDDAIVGYTEACRFAGQGEDVPWSYAGQNNAFVARFNDTPAPAAAREVLPCCAAPAE